jgi:hypothetical protein
VTDIVKGVLGGSWTLITGWMLPAALGLSFFGLVVMPSLETVPAFEEIAKLKSTDQAVILLAASVVLGLTFASLATPLYRVLEGYAFWPSSLQRKRIDSHRLARKRLHAEVASADNPGQPLDLRAALAAERYRRYPDHDDQVAPTELGNAIRRFEYYSYDRYQLSSQLMWSQLRGAVVESAAKEVDDARAGVDFFVCMLYVSGLVALSAACALFSDERDTANLVIAMVVAGVAALGSYRAAVTATDAWAAAVKAMVDLGRVPLAEALGLDLPDTLVEEREMWKRVGWFLGYAYHERGAAMLDPYRSRAADGDGATKAGSMENEET